MLKQEGQVLKNQRLLETEKLNPDQLKVFFTMIILYTFYFTVNYNLGPATKNIQDEFLISNAKFGVVFTVSTIVFAAGQFINGFLADRYSAKLIMTIGAVGAIVANYLFGLSSHLNLFVFFWGINAFFLSMGWAPGCSILFNWFPEKRWGLFMGIYNAFSFLGGVIVYPLAGFVILNWGWRYAFFIPPILLLIWILVYMKIVHNTPEEAGFRVEWRSQKCEEESEKIGKKDYWHVLTHPVLNLVYLSTICSQFVRWGLVNWIIKILIEPTSLGGFGISLVTAMAIAASMHWGGAFFSIGMGYISDRVFKGKRWQTVFIGFMLSAISIVILFLAGNSLLALNGGLVFIGVLLFIAGGCVQGLQAPLLNLPGDILGRRLGGTGNGIANGWSYIGASFSGIALGFLMDNYGYMSGMVLLAIVAIIGGIIILFVKR